MALALPSGVLAGVVIFGIFSIRSVLDQTSSGRTYGRSVMLTRMQDWRIVEMVRCAVGSLSWRYGNGMLSSSHFAGKNCTAWQASRSSWSIAMLCSAYTSCWSVLVVTHTSFPFPWQFGTELLCWNSVLVVCFFRILQRNWKASDCEKSS